MTSEDILELLILRFYHIWLILISCWWQNAEAGSTCCSCWLWCGAQVGGEPHGGSVHKKWSFHLLMSKTTSTLKIVSFAGQWMRVCQLWSGSCGLQSLSKDLQQHAHGNLTDSLGRRPKIVRFFPMSCLSHRDCFRQSSVNREVILTGSLSQFEAVVRLAHSGAVWSTGTFYRHEYPHRKSGTANWAKGQCSQCV